MRKLDAPTARDASMNSRSFSASTWPRTMRATVIQPKMASRKMTKRIDVCSPMIGVEPRDLAEHVAGDEQSDQEREGEEDVRHPHHHVVEAAAVQAGDGADRRRRGRRR